MKFLYHILVGLVVFYFSATVAIGGEVMPKYENLADVPPAKWQALSEKEIFFGHQSVGYNIIDGIQEVIKKHPDIKLNIVESRKYNDRTGAFVHSKIGENRQPDAKIKDFVRIIDHELSRVPDMAAMKFCFVDAYDKIDEQDEFQKYKQAMSKLKLEHPALTIIHFTMPLRTQPISWKTKVKLLIGREPWEFTDNIKRNQFNELLLQEYLGKQPVFDIARYEATGPDGKEMTFTYRGKSYLAMKPEYSSDGGHLNNKGQLWIAEKLLLFLVNQ